MPTRDVSARRVVIVDDSAEYRQLLALHLDAMDIRVVAAADSGRTGLAAAAETNPDLVVTDLQMPGTDGLWLARRLQADYPGLPVVMATTSAKISEVWQDARAAGVSRLVSKAAGPQAVVTAVQEQLARHAA